MKKSVWVVLFSGLVFLLIVSSFIIYNLVIWPHYPQGDFCQQDADCVCRSNNLDGCGEMGDVWKCIDNRCDTANIRRG